MSGGTFFRVLAALALVGVLVIIGVGAYNAGVSAGLAETGRQAVSSGAPAPYYPGPYAGHGWGWGPGFGILAVVFWILGIFLIFGLVRAAFGFGRWGGGRRDWGDHNGRRQHFEDWHRRAHESTPDAESR